MEKNVFSLLGRKCLPSEKNVVFMENDSVERASRTENILKNT